MGVCDCLHHCKHHVHRFLVRIQRLQQGGRQDERLGQDVDQSSSTSGEDQSGVNESCTYFNVCLIIFR